MQFPSVATLIPHGPPMRLVDSIVEEIEGGLVCRVLVDDGFVFLRNGEAELVVCVELVAQTVGCLAGLRDVRRGVAPKPGLLAGCRRASFSGDNLRAGDELLVKVQSQWVREQVASFTGQVVRGADVIAEVEIVVIATDDALLDSVAPRRVLRSGGALRGN